MFCWDWYLQHSKGLYTTFSPIKAVSFFTQTTKCLFWVSSQMPTAWSDPLETADNNYILNSSTIPQLQAYKPLFEYGEKSQFYHLLKRDRFWEHWHWHYCCLFAEANIINLHAQNCPAVANHLSDPNWSASFQWKITSEWKRFSTKLRYQPSDIKQAADWSPGDSHWPLPQ